MLKETRLNSRGGSGVSISNAHKKDDRRVAIIISGREWNMERKR